MLTLGTVLALAALFRSTAADQSHFTGCMGYTTMLTQYGPVLLGSDITSRASCESLGTFSGRTVTFYQSGSQLCWGSSTYIQRGDIKAGTDAFGNCVQNAATPRYGDVQSSQNNAPNFQGCYNGYVPNGQTPYYTGVGGGPWDCFAGQCQNAQNGYTFGQPFYATFVPSTGRCQCYRKVGGGQDPANGGGSLITCDPEQKMAYYSGTASANPSIYRKRADRLRLLQEKNLPKELCPAELSACSVVGAADSDSFECIDTDTELESCGGCFGRDLAGVSSYTGVNCLEMPGAALGGVTCEQGQCVTMACDYGYSLVNATCQAI